jgi:stage III sporulation protein AG
LLERIKKRIKEMGRRRLIALSLIFALGVALLLFSSVGGGEGGDADELSEYKARLERELSELCSSVDGVGECRVFVTFSEGESYEFQGGEIKATRPPRVQGVTVLCEGGGRAAVRAHVSELISALFDIGSNRICVMKLS